MSHSPAVSAGHLIERLQRDLQQLLELAGKLSAEVGLLAQGVNDRRENVGRYDYQGKSYTIRELARLCGLKYQTLYYRLRNGGMSVEDAVAAKLGEARPRTVKTEKASGTTKSKNVKHDFGGEQLTIAEISERTGLSRATLYGRMMRGATAYEAAQGVKQERASSAKPRAAAKPALTPEAPVRITAAPAVLAKEAEVTIPDDVKRTVAETPKPRFAPDVVVPTFGALKPGQYLDAGAPWIRAATGPRR